MNGVLYVSTAPKVWLTNDNKSCRWPRNKSKEKQAIIKQTRPEVDWLTLDVNVLGQFCTYKECLFEERKRENSYSSSDENEKGKGKRKKKVTEKYRQRDASVTPPPTLQYESESDSLSSNSGVENFSIKSSTSVLAPNTLPTIDENVVAAENIANAEIVFENIGTTGNENEVVKALTSIQATLEIIKAKIINIEDKLGSISINDEIFQDLLPKLPFTSVAEIEEFEQKLNASNVEKSFFHYLKCTGGINERNCIFRNLEKVFSNYVSQFCSWTGQKQNYKLGNLKVMKIMKSAVRTGYPLVTDESFEKAVMQWFQHGKTRYLREKRVE